MYNCPNSRVIIELIFLGTHVQSGTVFFLKFSFPKFRVINETVFVAQVPCPILASLL